MRPCFTAWLLWILLCFWFRKQWTKIFPFWRKKRLNFARLSIGPPHRRRLMWMTPWCRRLLFINSGLKDFLPDFFHAQNDKGNGQKRVWFSFSKIGQIAERVCGRKCSGGCHVLYRRGAEEKCDRSGCFFEGIFHVFLYYCWHVLNMFVEFLCSIRGNCRGSSLRSERWSWSAGNAPACRDRCSEATLRMGLSYCLFLLQIYSLARSSLYIRLRCFFPFQTSGYFCTVFVRVHSQFHNSFNSIFRCSVAHAWLWESIFSRLVCDEKYLWSRAFLQRLASIFKSEVKSQENYCSVVWIDCLID